MLNKPLPIGIIMAILASAPVYLLSLWDYQLKLAEFPLFAISLLVFFIVTAYWSANASAPRPAVRKPLARSRHERETGVVKWFNANKGFGFISRDNGDEIFVHFRAIRGHGHRVLEEGQTVEFGIVMGEKGQQAHDVLILS